MTFKHVFSLNAFFDDRSQNITSHDAAGECKTAKNRVLTRFHQGVGVLINARCYWDMNGQIICKSVKEQFFDLEQICQA